MRVEVTDWVSEQSRRVPQRWTGKMRAGANDLRYEARATTPVADVVPDGGFLGFDFEGEVRQRTGPSRRVTGTGFCEYRA